MKKLFVLLIIWLSLTFYLAYDNLLLKRFKEDNPSWRGFLVYSSKLSGCMTGAGFSNTDYDFLITYNFCRNYAFKEKEIYLGKWKQK